MILCFSAAKAAQERQMHLNVHQSVSLLPLLLKLINQPNKHQT